MEKRGLLSYLFFVMIAEQLRWVWPISTFPQDTRRRDDHGTGLPYIYSNLFDYGNKQIGMPEEEMVSLLSTSLSALKQISAGEASSSNWALLFSRFLSSGLFPKPKTIPETTDMSIIPLKNEQGNATAVGSMYCAVNANTQHADEAAFIVEYLLTEECQEISKIFRIHNVFGMPSMLINKNAQVEGDTQLTPATWEMACSQISRVYFPSLLTRS